MTGGSEYINGSKVVNSYPGRGTGDTYYRTSDGQLWHTLTPAERARLGTGDMVSQVITPKVQQ